MIRPDIPLMKNCSSNLQKVFQNILGVVLLDVKNQFTFGNIDPTIDNLQNMMETSISTKFQEEGFLTLHLKDFENSIVEYSINEESLIYEKSLLENKLRETQDKYDMDIESKMKVIEDLKKELKEKECALKDSLKSYDNFMKSNKELSSAKELSEKLEHENKRLKHRLKCMECKFDALKKTVLGDKEKRFKRDEEKLRIGGGTFHDDSDKILENIDDRSQIPKSPEEKEVSYVKSNNLGMEKSVGKEKSPKQEQISEKEKNHEKEQNHEKEKNHEKEINIMEDTLNLSSLNTQVELLTEQIDKLNSKKIQVEDDIDVKEGKIISLQSTIDKMKIIILQCKTKEHNLSLQLEYANVTIDKLQRTVGNLKKENEDIYKDVHRNNLKSTYIENQWDRIVTMSNKKNDKIQTLQDEKNSLLQKMKEKNNSLSDKDAENAKIKNDFDQMKHRYLKLSKDMSNVKNAYADLEKHCSLLQNEKESLECKLLEKENANESQLSRLLKQLNVSDDETKDEIAKSNQGVDISDIAERIINKHRHDLSSLKRNMCWMKEALEVSEKDRLEMQSQLSQRDEELLKVQAKLSMFEDANKHLSTSLIVQQSDTTSIQKVLHNAVASYDGVCSLFEKQERALAKERESYNSEIMELRDKLKRKQGSKPASGFRPVRSGVQFSDDLRFILGNIKEQLSSTLNNISCRQELDVPNYSNATSNVVHTFDGSIYDSGPEVIEDSTITNSPHNSSHDSNITIGSNTQKLNEYLEMHNSVIHQSDLSQSVFVGKNLEKTPIDHSKSSLYTSYPMVTSFEKEDNSNLNALSDTTLSSHTSQNSTCSSVQSVVENTSIAKATQKNDNNAVLKLQEKLSQLHQMGTNLKTNNTELTEMMKTHSKKLKMLKNKASDKK